jgi:hypothetical protein
LLLDEESQGRIELGTLNELIKASGEVGVLPTVRTHDKPRSGPRTEGHQWTRRFSRMLSDEVLEKMAGWVRSLRGKRPLWQIVVTTSQLALAPTVDFGVPARRGAPRYKTVQVQLPGPGGRGKHPRSGDFAAEHQQPTAAHPSREGAVGEMVSDMQRLLLEAMLKVFVHGVTVYNYRRRTERERRAFESAERRKREKRWKRKRARKPVKRQPTRRRAVRRRSSKGRR